MAYDETLGARVRAALAATDGIVEKKMFGGLGFMLHGNMCCGVLKDRLLVRPDPSLADELLRRPEVEPMTMGGRTSNAFLTVGRDAIRSDDELRSWMRLGIDYAASLPPK